MGQSFKEYITALGYWGLIVIAPIAINIIGVYQLVYNNQFTRVPSWLWFLIAFVLLLTIPFAAFHKLRTKRDEIQCELDGIKDTMPNIQTKTEVNNGRFYLVVRNIGRKGGLFTASGRVIVGKPTSGLYVMYWEGNGDKCQINGGGGVASILVAEKAKKAVLRDAESSIYEGGLALFKMGTSGEQTFPVHTIIEKPVIVDDKEGIEIVREAKCILEITITSDPPLLEEFGTHRYALEIKSENRDELLFVKLSDDNEGSKTRNTPSL